MPANEIGADALRFLVREAVAITALANVLDKTSEPDFVADAVLKVIAALEAPVSADADELAEQSKKPKAKRPWHRAVSSHVVNPVTIRQLRVLSQSRPLSPNEEQPAVQTVSPWAISSWMDSFAGLAGNALALGQSTMQSVLNASRTVLLGVQPEALDSNSETGETRPSSSPPESKPRLPAMHRPWLEFLVDSLALRDRDSPGSFLYNLITYLLEPALLWILGQNRLNALLTNVIAQSAAEKKIAVYLKQLRNALWPDGTFNRNPTVRTEEEKAELQLRAKEAIFARIPYAVRFALTDSYVAKHFDATWAAFQDKKAVEHLFLRITDAIVVKLFAEELDELAKLPSAAVPSARPALEPIVEPRPTTLQWDILSSMESDIRETRSFTPSPGIIPRTQSSPAQSPSRSRTTVLGRR